MSLAKYVKPVSTLLKAEETIEEALSALRKNPVEEKIIYFYVIDTKGTLIGVVSTRKLLLEDPKKKIISIMDGKIVSVRIDQDVEEALKLFANHNLLALPVIDLSRKFLGVIDVEMYLENSVDIAKEKHRREIFQLIGCSVEEGKSLSIWGDYKKRMPWILCNFSGGIVCAFISLWNEKILAQALVLVMFIPLVLTLSESISMQSMTHSLQFLQRPQLTKKRIFLRVFQEFKILLWMGLSAAVIGGMMAFFWKGGKQVFETLSVGIFVSVIVSALWGMVFPIWVFQREGDLKVASGPVVLMIADILTLVIYFLFARFFVF